MEFLQQYIHFYCIFNVHFLVGDSVIQWWALAYVRAGA